MLVCARPHASLQRLSSTECNACPSCTFTPHWFFRPRYCHPAACDKTIQRAFAVTEQEGCYMGKTRANSWFVRGRRWCTNGHDCYACRWIWVQMDARGLKRNALPTCDGMLVRLRQAPPTSPRTYNGWTYLRAACHVTRLRDKCFPQALLQRSGPPPATARANP